MSDTSGQTATEALRSWAACAVAADMEGWAALTTDGMTYTHSNSLFETRDDVVAAFGAGRRYTRFEFSDTIESQYDGAAVVTGITHAAVDRDPPLKLDLRFTAMLVNAGEGWRVAGYQTTPLPA